VAGGAALSVDVEEWYHNCWMPEYVEPARRPPLAEELDHLLPELLERLARRGRRATFFVLGEVGRRLPERIVEVHRAGHEVACHGEVHLRANDRPAAEFRRDIVTAKARLEDLIGAEVTGYRAPEWSLRSIANPRLRVVAECGFRYDSSLSRALGAGDRRNPVGIARVRWPDGLALTEVPPALWSRRWRLPLGGWCVRIASAARVERAVGAAVARGELPVLVVHPWELPSRACPGLLTGLGRFLHEAGREGYAARFERVLERLPLDSTLSTVTTRAISPAAAKAPAGGELLGWSPARLGE
jgi:peptidoglycan/xylan/chitin deacetylase (PgdA/CDA1 family)